MMFTQEEYDDARRLAFDQGFNMGSGMDPAIKHTEAYIDVRERALSRPVKPQAPAPRRPMGDFLGDGEGRGL